MPSTGYIKLLSNRNSNWVQMKLKTCPEKAKTRNENINYKIHDHYYLNFKLFNAIIVWWNNYEWNIENRKHCFVRDLK